MEGVSTGFRVDFSRRCQLQPPPANILTKSTAVITECLQQDVSLGRMQKHELPVKGYQVHISPIGAIPKRNKPGKWRLIVDLLTLIPSRGSVNDEISPDFPVSYVSVSFLVLSAGRGAFLAKADIKKAYRMLLVHPQDQPPLGVQWAGITYTDLALPFGLQSALKLYLAMADALQWILVQKGITNLLHYLDDFIFVSKSLDEGWQSYSVHFC